mgnify:FL=1
MPNLTDKLVRDQRIKKEDIKKIEIFISEALKFNKHHNIFVRNSKEEIFEKDVFDCLPAINMIRDKQKVLDLGSGGGFPGILIGILKNHTKVFLLEKNQKKISFLNKIIFQLNLTNTETINTSLVEKNNLQNFDVITARAFSSINNILKLTKNNIDKNGYYLLLKGKIEKINDEIQQVNTNKYKYEIINLNNVTKERHLVKITNE